MTRYRVIVLDARSASAEAAKEGRDGERQNIDPIPNEAGTVTVQAWERWEDGFETVAFLWSERFDQNEVRLPFLPGCPTDQRIIVQWRYQRATGFFDDAQDPHWVVSTELIDRDKEWKPCVGRSPTGGGAPYPNSDRAEMAVNRAWPWAFTKTDDKGLARVRLRKNGSPNNYTTPSGPGSPPPTGRSTTTRSSPFTRETA